MNIRQKIPKLIKGLEQAGYIYMVHYKQYYSEKAGKPLTIIKLTKLITAKEYVELHPKSKGNKPHYEINVMESFKASDILIELAKIYKKARGDKDAIERTKKTIC